MDDFSTYRTPNAFGLYPSPCMFSLLSNYFASLARTHSKPNSFYHTSDNYPQPGKRPLSSIAPTIIEQPSSAAGSSASSSPHHGVHLILGGSGGSRIFPSIVQTILNVDWGMDVSAAVEAPRIHDQLFPPVTDVESGYDSEMLGSLVKKGHNVICESCLGYLPTEIHKY